MSTTPRVSSAIPGEPPHFGSVLAHRPALAARFAELYGAFWASDVLSARIKELCRMRNARITACGFCRQVRFDKPLGEGLDEAVLNDIADDYAASDRLTDAEKAALRFTDALIHDPALLDGEARAALHRHFTAEQITELGLGVALFLALAKVLIVLGLEPEGMDRTVLPTPRSPTDGQERVHSLTDGYAQFRDAAWADSAVDPALLAMARHRVTRQHDGVASEEVDDPALAFGDKIPFAHHTIADDEADAARDALGDAGLVAFTLATALADADCRLAMLTAREMA
jgi:alkylhydroperoxidase family enzyme